MLASAAQQGYDYDALSIIQHGLSRRIIQLGAFPRQVFDFLMWNKWPEVYKAIYWNYLAHESRGITAYGDFWTESSY